ncbi:MAG: hypothetical protein ABRQ38_16745 [Candidatus Eremiobacterota bacterium]
MKWIKKGRIFEATGNFGWMNSHAQIPAILVKPDILRIYFASRPEQCISMTTFIDVDIDDPAKIIYLHDKPILELGRPGSFDEHGIMPGYICEYQGQVWLYYGGWSRRTTIPYSNWTGLAISDDGGITFRRAFDGPLIDRTPLEIYSGAACFILKQKDKWHMWYGSGEEWIKVEDKYEEYYEIKYASSNDGITWIRDGRKILSHKEYEPTQRPTVFFYQGKYHMLFCYRGMRDFRDGKNSYRIGYAWSNNLIDWIREDEIAGIETSDSGWDSTMLAYPYVVKGKEKFFLFYNGNGFGKTGFGYAELQE